MVTPSKFCAICAHDIHGHQCVHPWRKPFDEWPNQMLAKLKSMLPVEPPDGSNAVIDDALSGGEWKAVHKRRLKWCMSKDGSTITATDPNTQRSASGRTLCAAVRGVL